MKIRIQQLNSDGIYSYYYPEYTSNSDMLDGLHKDSFLTEDSPCSTNNLNVWIATLQTYSFNPVLVRADSTNAAYFDFPSQFNTIAVATFIPTGVIGSTNIGGQFMITSVSKAVTGSYNQIGTTQNHFILGSSSSLSIGDTVSYENANVCVTPSSRNPIYLYISNRGRAALCYREGVDDDGNQYISKYPNRLNSISPTLQHSNYAVYSIKPSFSIGIWINETQKYSSVNNLLEKISS